MGTRAMITWKGEPLMATHWDGYPDSLGRDLVAGRITDKLSVIKAASNHGIDAVDLEKYGDAALNFERRRFRGYERGPPPHLIAPRGRAEVRALLTKAYIAKWTKGAAAAEPLLEKAEERANELLDKDDPLRRSLGGPVASEPENRWTLLSDISEYGDFAEYQYNWDGDEWEFRELGDWWPESVQDAGQFKSLRGHLLEEQRGNLGENSKKGRTRVKAHTRKVNGKTVNVKSHWRRT